MLNTEQDKVADIIGALPQPKKPCRGCEGLGVDCHIINMAKGTSFQRDELLNSETTNWSDTCAVPEMFNLIDRINALGE